MHQETMAPIFSGGATRNGAVTEMWKSYFAAWKKLSIDPFVKQNINSHENFGVSDDLMCNSHKVKSLIHTLTLNDAAGK